MKIKEWFRKLVAGLAIGAGAAIPGVSGAAIAVIFHVYEDIIGAVNNFRKRFGWAIKVLIPILLGIIIAVVACIIIFSYAFE
jgi:putative membrane protein